MGQWPQFWPAESLRQLRPDDRYLELVHRLDRDTSGLIMIARRSAMLRELHRQLREDEVDKRYLALVAGSWPRSLRVVEAPLEKCPAVGERMVRVAREGKRSITEFTIVERFEAQPCWRGKADHRSHITRSGCTPATPAFPCWVMKYSDEGTAGSAVPSVCSACSCTPAHCAFRCPATAGCGARRIWIQISKI